MKKICEICRHDSTKHVITYEKNLSGSLRNKHIMCWNGYDYDNTCGCMNPEY